MTTQLRVPAGQTGGGQFASKACPAVYALLDTLAPDPESSTRIVVPAPRCPHGSFARWAARNCCAPRAAAPATSGGLAPTCTGRTTDGDDCTRRTTRLNRHGHPACHSHGGHPATVAA